MAIHAFSITWNPAPFSDEPRSSRRDASEASRIVLASGERESVSHKWCDISLLTGPKNKLPFDLWAHPSLPRTSFPSRQELEDESGWRPFEAIATPPHNPASHPVPARISPLFRTALRRIHSRQLVGTISWPPQGP